MTKELESNTNKTGNVMQFRRFLGNIARTCLAIGALSVSAFAGADDYHYNEISNCNPCSTSCQPASCCYTGDCCGFPVNPAPECGWAYNPPAYVRCGCESNDCCNSFLDSFAFRADFLWWRVSEEGLRLGTEERIDTFAGSGTPARDTVTNISRAKKPNFKYDPGFRIGLATACACDCWDFAVNWTHFHTKAKARGASDLANNIIFVPDWERLAFAFPTTSTGDYKLNLDWVDIEFGRKYFVSNCFVLRPQFGLRFVRAEQTFRVESRATSTDLLDILSNFESHARARSYTLAVGPRIGLDLELHLCGGFALFGQAAGSVVFGKFSNHSREEFTDFTTSTGREVGAFNYEAKGSAHRGSTAITDMAFGVKWSRCLMWCNRSHPVTLAFAWEHHAFHNFNNFNFSPDEIQIDGDAEFFVEGRRTQKCGDMFTQGLTVTVAFGF